MIDLVTSTGSRQCDHYNCHLDYIHHDDHHADNQDDHQHGQDSPQCDHHNCHQYYNHPHVIMIIIPGYLDQDHHANNHDLQWSSALRRQSTTQGQESGELQSIFCSSTGEQQSHLNNI